MRSIICSSVLVVSFLIVLCPGCAQQQLQVDTSWPEKPASFEWAQMPGITLDGRDQVYIFTRSNPAVQVYKTDGAFVRSWNSGDFSGSHYIRIGPEGNIWTANITDHVVRKHSPEGRL
ncbi:MAG: hypothetical protein ACYSUX_18265, partial [Planctomycetota bacterium]